MLSIDFKVNCIAAHACNESAGSRDALMACALLQRGACVAQELESIAWHSLRRARRSVQEDVRGVSGAGVYAECCRVVRQHCSLIAYLAPMHYYWLNHGWIRVKVYSAVLGNGNTGMQCTHSNALRYWR